MPTQLSRNQLRQIITEELKRTRRTKAAHSNEPKALVVDALSHVLQQKLEGEAHEFALSAWEMILGNSGGDFDVPAQYEVQQGMATEIAVEICKDLRGSIADIAFNLLMALREGHVE